MRKSAISIVSIAFLVISTAAYGEIRINALDVDHPKLNRQSRAPHIPPTRPTQVQPLPPDELHKLLEKSSTATRKGQCDCNEPPVSPSNPFGKFVGMGMSSGGITIYTKPGVGGAQTSVNYAGFVTFNVFPISSGKTLLIDIMAQPSSNISLDVQYCIAISDSCVDFGNYNVVNGHVLATIPIDPASFNSQFLPYIMVKGGSSDWVIDGVAAHVIKY